MEKIEIASEILKNCRNHQGVKGVLDSYIEFLKNGTKNPKKLDLMIRIDNCISYIKDVDFDIKGWELYDIPIITAYCFWNTQTKQAFDLAIFNIGEVIPQYMDSACSDCDANSIDEAIIKYDTTSYLLANC